MKTQADKLRGMVDAERLRSEALDILSEWAEPLDQWVAAFTEVQEAIENASGCVEGWQDAEGREERADARDEALTAIEGLLGAIMTLDELPELPDLCESPAAFQIVRTVADHGE